MKTKIIILSVLIAALTFISVFAGNKNLNNVNDYKIQVTNLLQKNLLLTKEMDQTTANIFIKFDENGTVSDIRVNYPDEAIANEIKRTIVKEKFNITQDEAGIYKLKVTFNVR